VEATVHFINSIIWSKALIFMCLAAGLYFSVRTRFMQIRGFFEMCRLTVAGEKSDAGVSSFQALAMSMAGRMGIGNIAGVATAIAFGGPGAIFWMWVMGFLGASTSYVECTLAQIYKTKDAEGRYRGGPAYYIEKAMGLKWYAMAFALATIVAAGFLMPGVQANAIADSIINACRGGALCGPLDGQAFGMDQVQALKLGIGVVVAVLLAVVIFGGVKRIANFAEIVVPFMAAGFIIMAIVIMIMNADQVPVMFNTIFSSAFGTHAAFGAMIGLAVEWGVKRGIYANEAGQGTGPHAAAASEVSHPAKQGYVQAFAIYFDTMMVCTATAFLILASGLQRVLAGRRRRADLPGPEGHRRGCRLCAGRRGSGTAGLGRLVRGHRDLLLRLHHDHGLLLHGRNQPDLPQQQRQASADGAVAAPGHHRHGHLRRVPQRTAGLGAGRHRRRPDGLAEHRGDPDRAEACHDRPA